MSDDKKKLYFDVDSDESPKPVWKRVLEEYTGKGESSKEHKPQRSLFGSAGGIPYKKVLPDGEPPKSESTPKTVSPVSPTRVVAPYQALPTSNKNWSNYEKSFDFSTEKWESSGCVVLSGLDEKSCQYVYLVRPSNGYGPVSFPKGRVEGDKDTKNLKKTAVREVLEETGLKCTLIPGGYLGKFTGTSSETHFYMAFKTGGSTEKHDWESESVYCLHIDDAITLLKGTSNKRDVQVGELVKKWISGYKAGISKNTWCEEAPVTPEPPVEAAPVVETPAPVLEQTSEGIVRVEVFSPVTEDLERRDVDQPEPEWGDRRGPGGGGPR